MVPIAYVRICLAGVALILLAAGAFDWLIDPYFLYGTRRFAGLNAVKSEFITHTRLGKAYVVRRLSPTVVVLGSSRAEHGIDPNHPAWAMDALPRYNLALSGVNIYEVLAYLRHANSTAQLKQVVLGMDFFMFNAHRANQPDFDESILSRGNFINEISALLRLLQLAISTDSIHSSFETLRSQRAEFAQVNDNGRRTSVSLEQFVRRHGGHHGAFLASEEDFFRQNYLPPTKGGFEFEDQSGRSTLADFRAIVEFARREDIDLHLFISPSHAHDLEGLVVAELWPKFEEWKRQLVAILAADAAAHPDRKPFELWDFSGYNSVTTELVPPRFDAKATMRWYWDSSHYKKEVGDMVLNRVLLYTEPSSPGPIEFGVPLSTANIEAHLESIRDGQYQYEMGHPQDIAEIRELARNVRFQKDPVHK